jgi:hypothetical protein
MFDYMEIDLTSYCIITLFSFLRNYFFSRTSDMSFTTTVFLLIEMKVGTDDSSRPLSVHYSVS